MARFYLGNEERLLYIVATERFFRKEARRSIGVFGGGAGVRALQEYALLALLRVYCARPVVTRPLRSLSMKPGLQVNVHTASLHVEQWCCAEYVVLLRFLTSRRYLV